MQFQVTVEVPPHAGAGPNDALHAGGPLVPMHETDVVAVPVVPSTPTALMVQVSPEGPTVYGLDPEHGIEPLDGEVPVHT